jgi:hypothetical protein
VHARELRGRQDLILFRRHALLIQGYVYHPVRRYTAAYLLGDAAVVVKGNAAK